MNIKCVGNVNNVVMSIRGYYEKYTPKPMGIFYAVFELGLESDENGVPIKDILTMADIPLSYEIEFSRAVHMYKYIKDFIDTTSTIEEVKEKFNLIK